MDKHYARLVSDQGPRAHDDARTATDDLKGFAGGRTLPEMDPASREYVDLKTALVAAQNDARFAEVIAEIRGLRDDLASKPSTWQMVGSVFAGAATILGVLLAILAYGGDRFDGGVGLADQRQEQIQRDAEQDAIITRLDALLAARAAPTAPSSGAPVE